MSDTAHIRHFYHIRIFLDAHVCKPGLIFGIRACYLVGLNLALPQIYVFFAPELITITIEFYQLLKPCTIMLISKDLRNSKIFSEKNTEFNQIYKGRCLRMKARNSSLLNLI